jgi:hypothetical protein
MVAHLCADERVVSGTEIGAAVLPLANEQAAGDPPVTDWRGFHDTLRRAAIAATQSGAPLSLLMLEPGASARDEPVADTEMADGRIDTLAGKIAAEVGEGSALARYAEQRMAVIMLETGLAEAVVHAERIGQSLCSGEADEVVRPAIGVAQFHDDESLGHLIERVADALGRARSDHKLIAVADQRVRRRLRPCAPCQGSCPCGLDIHACLCGLV